MNDESTSEEKFQARPDQDEAGAGEREEVDATALLLQQMGELKDRMLRQQAEFDNVRKRLRREAEESGVRSVARFCRPVLDQIDNLTRALGAAKPEAFAEFAQGVSMIREGLLGALAAQGIEPLAAEGIFDPAQHEVLAEVANSEVAKGTIVEVHRAGYRLGDQLVRAAQVVVARPPA